MVQPMQSNSIMVTEPQIETKDTLGQRIRAFTLGVLISSTMIPLKVTAMPVRCEDVIFSKQEIAITARFSGGAKDFYHSQKFVRELERLSDQEKSSWIQDIGSVYRFVPKKDPNPTASWHIGGRRLLDYSLMLLQRHDLKFAADMAKGQSAQQAYDQFLREQNKAFGSRYDSSELMQFAQFLRDELRVLHSTGPSATLVLGGSFVNGKARLNSSDLDISVSDPRLLRFKNSWEVQLNTLLKRKYPEAALEIEMHAVPANFYGKINTFVISIDANQIHLLVFEPSRIADRPSELNVGLFHTHQI